MNAPLKKPLPLQLRPASPTSNPALLLPRGHLVSAKLKPPQTAATLVDRPALRQAIDDATAKQLLVVTAQIGSGKTTLLSQWRRHVAQRPVAWFTIDEHDNHPRRFFSYLVAAVREAIPGFEGYVTGALQDAVDFQTHHMAAVFLESLGRIGQDLVVVLDDFQWITDPEVVRALHALLRHAPPNVCWIVASRCVPELPLSEFKLRDQLTQLGTRDLNFQADQIADLSERLHDRALAPDDAEEIRHCTEGWVAGVKLALLTADDRPRIGDAVRRFDGSHEAVARYLAETVLQGQPDDLREFLVVSSVVDKMCSGLCNALLGTSNGQAVLEHLERSQLFLHSLDPHRRHYRYHLLFQDFLRGVLQRDHADRIPSLHRAASAWYVQNDLPHEALTHAFASGDRTWCVDVAGRCALHWLKQGETPEILRWAGMLSLAEILTHGDLTCAWIMSLILARRFGDAAAALEQAQQRMARVRLLATGTPRATLAARLQVLDLMLHAETVGGPRLDEGELMPDGDADFFAGLLMAAQTAHLLCVNEFEAMRRVAIRASAVGRACGSPYLTSHCETLIGIADFMQGRLADAAAICERNHEAHRRFHRSPAWVNAALGHACTLYEKNKLDDAQALLTEVLPFVSAASILRNFVLAYALLARLKGLQQRHGEAFRLLDYAHSVIERDGHPRFKAQICFEKIRLHIECGDGAGALATAMAFSLPERAQRGEWARMREYEEEWARSGAALALLWLHEQRHAEARALLQVLRDSAEKAGRVSRQVSAEVTIAMCHWSEGRPEAAFSALNRCVVPTRQFVFARTAFDETPAVSTLLAAAIGAGRLRFIPPSSYFKPYTLGAQRAAAAPSSPTPAPPTEPLTDRELQILGLVSKGLCNKTISATSRIALNTIKWHLRNAFTKLDVHSRTGAVARARELHLID